MGASRSRFGAGLRWVGRGRRFWGASPSSRGGRGGAAGVLWRGGAGALAGGGGGPLRPAVGGLFGVDGGGVPCCWGLVALPSGVWALWWGGGGLGGVGASWCCLSWVSPAAVWVVFVFPPAGWAAPSRLGLRRGGGVFCGGALVWVVGALGVWWGWVGFGGGGCILEINASIVACPYGARSLYPFVYKMKLCTALVLLLAVSASAVT